MTARHARAAVGAGLLVEYLAQRIVARGARRTPIPLVLNGTLVGAGTVGRESVSIDISHAGDPMDVRHIRCAFSAYQKHRFRPDIFGHRVAAERPAFVAVPRGAESLVHLLAHERDLAHAVRAARSRSAAIPDVTEGVARLASEYGQSALARFHQRFYAEIAGGDADDGERAFQSLPFHRLPPCVVRPLVAPNDLLLQPAVVQHVTRALMADGMPASAVAGVVRSRYSADFNWGARWQRMDPTSRAEFDVRVFAGMMATGLDRGVDFNCRSAQEKGLCPGGHCPHDLRDDRARLLEMAPTS
jgi:hypothetical protein